MEDKKPGLSEQAVSAGHDLMERAEEEQHQMHPEEDNDPNAEDVRARYQQELKDGTLGATHHSEQQDKSFTAKVKDVFK